MSVVPPTPAPTLRALVVDDEPLAARRLARALEGEAGLQIVALCHDGQEALAALETAGCDVLFLDVQMPGLDGMSLARAIADPQGPLVVFVTAFGQFAAEAFGVEAVDYLLKPVETDRLRLAIARVRERLAARASHGELAELRRTLASLRGAGAPDFEIWAPTAQGAVRLFPDQIDWIAAEDDYVRLHTATRSYLLRATLQDLLNKLGPGDMVRVHRSGAINAARIHKITRLPYGALAVQLVSGYQVRVSRSHAAALRRRLKGRNTAVRAAPAESRPRK